MSFEVYWVWTEIYALSSSEVPRRVLLEISGIHDGKMQIPDKEFTHLNKAP